MDEDLRDFLLKGGALPARLAREFGDDDESVAVLSNWSFTQRWAWEELQRRLRVCLDQSRPPTGLLAFWAATVVAGGRKPPRQNANEDRDWRVLEVVTALVRRGYSEWAAVRMVAREINKAVETIYSILRKIRAGPHGKKKRQTST